MHIWATSMTTFSRGSSNQTPTRRGFLWRSSMVSLLKWHNTRYATLKACLSQKVEVRCLANKMFLDSELLSMKCRGSNGKLLVRNVNKKLCTHAHLVWKASQKTILCRSSDKTEHTFCSYAFSFVILLNAFLAGRDIEISQGSEGGRKEPRACLIPWELKCCL